jgi:hypothetical protein
MKARIIKVESLWYSANDFSNWGRKGVRGRKVDRSTHSKAVVNSPYVNV